MVLNSVVIQSESCVNQSDSCELYAKMKEKYTKTNLCSLTINLKALNICKLFMCIFLNFLKLPKIVS